ncbi:hypothetical protein DHEL01_v200214 [Diaporthe helianthi]|uniref:Biotrophy-associated secreted protein 2 n=1 Tax=Diaporthe helianthi TaxID=158607 RepID=A0A2P5IFV6_DIAHE|nr:hypothetical protein DHEL01_v200214 [Diaporthe helianthi]
MVALKATTAITLLFALQGAIAFSSPAPADSPSSFPPVKTLRSAKHQQRQAAQKPPVLEPQPAQLPDPSLASAKGNGNNAQFITGECVDSADCGASQTDLTKVCCASVKNQAGATVGVCSGSAVGNAAPKLGCGFGDGKVNSAAGAGAAAGAQEQAAAGGAGGAFQDSNGTQTGGGTGGAAANNAASDGDAAAAAAPSSGSGRSCPPTTTNDSLGPGNVGVAGKQFVTGQCTSDANCASNCCVLGGGSDKSIAVCRNEPALKPTEKCGFTCTA